MYTLVCSTVRGVVRSPRPASWRPSAIEACCSAAAAAAARPLGARFRGTKADPPQRRGFGPSSTKKGRFPPTRSPPASHLGPLRKNKRPVDSDQLRSLLINRLPIWAASARATQRLQDLGFSTTEAKTCLRVFSQAAVRDLKGKEKATDQDLRDWDDESLKIALGMDIDSVDAVEKVLLRRALEWSASAGERGALIDRALAIRLRDMLEATDLRDLPQDYPDARQMQRHFHLHIGPTNSGKTYNALKALTAARTGAYAGPLRLLAHEVWERINLGTVGNLTEGKGRECNLLTGEEQRAVSQTATLTSCTVEMLPLGQELDVVVIDEIQMIADTSRGAAWTTALLGMCAKEIHLCGEETVVGVVSRLVEDMGDKLTIHRYERLTPLNVAKESLGGDLGRIEDGDCIVSFSRSGIFATKKLIEQKTGKRCAVVYGALPPETRSEQAKLFNEEGNGVNVMVASDAVGMGLNLKIKRMVFEAMHKYNGYSEVPLSVSQVKQIAGRAGRFGTHGTSAGGIVTTLKPEDLPILKAVLPSALPVVPQIAMDTSFARIHKLGMLLGEDRPFSSILQTFADLARLPPYGFFSDVSGRLSIAEHLGDYAEDLGLGEAETFTYAPVSIRDENVVAAFKGYIRDFVDEGRVDVERVLDDTGLLDNYELVKKARDDLPDGHVTGTMLPGVVLTPISYEIVTALPKLESLHKALVLYIWLSFRLELAFPERIKAVQMKERAEELLDFCLERLPGLKRTAHSMPGMVGRRNRKQQVRSLMDQERKRPRVLTWLTREEATKVRTSQRFGQVEIMD